MRGQTRAVHGRSNQRALAFPGRFGDRGQSSGDASRRCAGLLAAATRSGSAFPPGLREPESSRLAAPPSRRIVGLSDGAASCHWPVNLHQWPLSAIPPRPEPSRRLARYIKQSCRPSAPPRTPRPARGPFWSHLPPLCLRHPPKKALSWRFQFTAPASAPASGTAAKSFSSFSPSLPSLSLSCPPPHP